MIKYEPASGIIKGYDLLEYFPTNPFRSIIEDESGDLWIAGSSGVEELIDIIVWERHAELLMEGNRIHDLSRLRRDVNGRSYKEPKLRWPIPQREIDANSNIVQNPGY